MASITTSVLSRYLGDVDRAIERVEKSNGSVDVDAVADAIRSTAGKAAFEAVKDAYTRITYCTSYTGTCGNTRSTVAVPVPPEELSKKEVQRVADALIDAKLRVRAFDRVRADGTRGRDGVLDESEVLRGLDEKGEDLPGKLAHAVLKDTADAKGIEKPRPAPRTSYPVYGGC